MFRNNSFNNISEGRKKASLIFFIILMLAAVAYMLITGVRDLTDQSGICEGDIDMATKGMVLEHSINGLIPTGMEYYYIGLNSEDGRVYLIRAGKHWFDDNFEEATYTAKAGHLKVSGRLKNVDYDVSREIASRFAELDGSECTFVTGSSQCYNLIYKSDAIKKIICAVLMILTAVILALAALKGDGINTFSKFGVVGVVLMIICMVFMIYVMSTTI